MRRWSRLSGLTDHRLHHQRALKVTDPAAVERLALLHTCEASRESKCGSVWPDDQIEGAATASKHTEDPLPALQLEGVFPPAEVIDEEPELVHVLQALRHSHLLVDQVGLRQVGASLGSTNTTDNR